MDFGIASTKKNKWLLIIPAVLFAFLILFLDYITGIELDFSIFYMLPILFLTWYVGFNTGLVFAFLGEGFDVIANLLAGKVYSNAGIFYWDIIQDLAIYVFFVFIVSRLRTSVDNLRELTESQAQTNRFLQEANEAKNEILRIVSHDLKNPLIGIQGLARRLADKNIRFTDENVRTYGSTILNATDKMFLLIDNLLEADKYENGVIPLSEEEFDLSEKIRQVLQKYRKRLTDKKLKVSFSCDEPVAFIGDSLVMEQIFDNLVSNAIKFTPCCKQIDVELQERSGYVFLEVKDEGPGIRQEDMEKLFRKFSRLSSKTAPDEHSSGLGLYIVRRLVEAQDGEVWCESEAGQGAKFVVKLPAKTARKREHI